jgi:hypothetical protein
MLDDPPIVLPEQDQAMREHSPRPQHPAPYPQLQTPERRRRPPTLESRPLSGLEHLGLVIPQKPRPGVPTLRETEAVGNTSDVDVDVDVDQQLRIESAGGNILFNISLPDVPLIDVCLPDVLLPDIPPLELCPDGSAGEE